MMGIFARVKFTFMISIIANAIISKCSEILVSTFYEDVSSFEFNCSVQFDEPRTLDCACVSGLWILYGSCSENVTLMGDDTSRCYNLYGTPIRNAVQLLRTRQDLAAISHSGDIKPIYPEVRLNLDLDKRWVLVTGSKWTLVQSSGTRICLLVEDPESYCYFSKIEDSLEDLEYVERGCDFFDYFVGPGKCEPIRGHDDNICDVAPESIHKLVKRQADITLDSDIITYNYNITDVDEDYDILRASQNITGGNHTELNKLMGDAILEYMEGVLDGLLGTKDSNKVSTRGSKRIYPKQEGRRKKAILPKDAVSVEDIENTNKNPLNLTHWNPVYEFLEISKRIMQKTCPSFYVKPAFFNLAVATFIRLQQVHFKFTEHTFKPVGFRRILKYLRKCEQGAQTFTFSPGHCDGKYTAYNQEHELVLPQEAITLGRHPIVETVWKIFYNVHSYCYPYFNTTLDHHRFTAWMVPLFQNQMNDIWTSGETSEKSFSGLFGNQIEVQKNLAYCSTSSRLDSSYPFDLPRPHRVYEFGHGSAVANATGRRKKRDASLYIPEPLGGQGTCIDESQPFLCAQHVTSIIGS